MFTLIVQQVEPWSEHIGNVTLRIRFDKNFGEIKALVISFRLSKTILIWLKYILSNTGIRDTYWV